MGDFSDAVIQQFPPQIQSGGLQAFVAALGEIFQQIDTLAHSDPPWSILLDIDTIPDEGVPWLAQFVGISTDLSLTVDQQRQQIRDHAGWGRGTPAALKASIKKFLSGTQTVEIVERDTSPYHFSIVTYSDETPAEFTYADLYALSTYEDIWEGYDLYETIWLQDAGARIYDTIVFNKPAALMFDYTVVPGSPGTTTSYEDLWIDHTSYDDVWESFETYQDVWNNP